MLTLTRRIGERILAGELTVEVADVRGDAVTLRLHGIANEVAVRLAEASADERPPARRRRRVEPPPLIVEVRRSRSRS